MSDEAHLVAMPSEDDLPPRVSSLSKEADIVVKSSGEGVPLRDPSQSQQQGITVDTHSPHISIDELLKVIKGSNGMPVLFVPSSGGRLAAVAVDGLQNLMPANREGSVSNEKEQNFRSWLMFLTSLVATVTFTAGLTPPGGFWSADDKDKKYLAGDPIMDTKSPTRYRTFYYSNTLAFFTSLTIIASLAKNRNSKRIMTIPFTLLVVFCFLSLGSAYVSGTWIKAHGPSQLKTVVLVLALNIVYMMLDRIQEKCLV
ncbi:uncharacterized protein LOC125513047 [Triticum urartu]|uniref:uncharacterized protein LOC125513047 n=1 Tax=Triticum urartu TaxID=4572 RepID=UPI0020430DFE|nr:uncharacterized protein LOC125513047 [Triticum urartu]